MKRFLSALVCAASVFALTACGGTGNSTANNDKQQSQDPKTVFSDAVKKTSDLSSNDITMKMKMAMSSGDQSIDIDMDMDAQLAKKGDNDYDMASTMSMKMMDQVTDMTMYYTDGYYYMDVAGQKMKYAMDVSEMLEKTQGSVELFDMNTEGLKDFTMKKDGDNQVITYVGDPEKMSDMVQEIMSAMGDQMSSMLGEESNIEISKIEGTATVDKDGYVSAQKLLMDLSMTAEGEKVAITYDIDMTNNNPGKDVVIELPTDLADYMEIDESMLQAAS